MTSSITSKAVLGILRKLALTKHDEARRETIIMIAVRDLDILEYCCVITIYLYSLILLSGLGNLGINWLGRRRCNDDIECVLIFFFFYHTAWQPWLD